jgi:hypothetical protein
MKGLRRFKFAPLRQPVRPSRQSGQKLSILPGLLSRLTNLARSFALSRRV